MTSKYHKKAQSVLIADDDRVIRMILKKNLTSMGLTIVGEATNGLEAACLFDKTRPDLVLLDLNMPKGNGLTILRLIHDIDPKAIVIILTGETSEDVIKSAIELGAFDYLSKKSDGIQVRLRKSLQRVFTF